MEGRQFQGDLLAWYDAHRRPLPWRNDTDAYRVMVSEFMCQQTRVAVAGPYFERWMARWPTVHDVAQATEADVHAAWSGLGYYRRARNLHAACIAVAKHGWPADLRALPGVGPYIAAAVGSIAFDAPTAAVDGNVQRVMARVHGIRDDITRGPGKVALQRVADSALAAARPGDWNQAVMELGAMVCTPTSPQCGECPVATHCESAGDAEGLPVKTNAKPPRHEDVHFAMVRRTGRILMHRRATGLLAGTWMLPGGLRDEPLEDHVKQQTGAAIETGGALGEVRHVFSHRHWTMVIHDARLIDEPKLGENCAWIPQDSLAKFGLSTAMRKALDVATLHA